MFKLVKYEIMDNIKELYIILGIGIILNLIVLITSKKSNAIVLPTFLAVLIAVGCLVAIFISSIKMMSSYLYEDKGYLLLTIPQKGYSILCSRLISALIENIIVGALCFSFVMINLSRISIIKPYLYEYVNVKTVLISVGSAVISYIDLLLLIYFAVVAGKAIFGNRKTGKFGGFIIFFAISIADGYITELIKKVFPYSFKVGSIISEYNYKLNALNEGTSLASMTTDVNIGVIIFTILLWATLFICTSYIIDKRIEV